MFCRPGGPPRPPPSPQWPRGDPAPTRSSAEAFRPVMLTPCEKAYAGRSVGVTGGWWWGNVARYGGLTASETVLILPQQVGQ